MPGRYRKGIVLAQQIDIAQCVLRNGIVAVLEHNPFGEQMPFFIRKIFLLFGKLVFEIFQVRKTIVKIL